MCCAAMAAAHDSQISRYSDVRTILSMHGLRIWLSPEPSFEMASVVPLIDHLRREYSVITVASGARG